MGIIDRVSQTATLIKGLVQGIFQGAHLSGQKQREYQYITLEEVIEFNKLLTRQAGLLRDRGGLESAIMRPQTAAYYKEADIATQTALLIDGIAMAHAFIDGNKRTALLAGVTFLEINGYKLQGGQNQLGKQIGVLVTGQDIELFTKWLRVRIKMLYNVV